MVVPMQGVSSSPWFHGVFSVPVTDRYQYIPVQIGSVPAIDYLPFIFISFLSS
jgi:hypothetical protein